MAESFDVIVIGAGHNGLVCANALQRSGLNTLILERRPIVGGAVCTEEIVPGYQFDVGSSVHIMVHQTDIVDAFDLKSHGLEYCPMDPWATYPIPDGSGRFIAFHKDLEQTVASIEAVAPGDGKAYRQFIEKWTPIARGTFKAFLQPPTMASLGMNLMLAKAPDQDNMVGLHKILSSYGRLIAESFESPYLRSALAWLAAQSGPPPTELGSAPFAGWHAVVHETGAAHPRGGSGMLTQALAKSLTQVGGTVRTDASVEQILVENGKAVGVVVGGETIRARAVVSACHVWTTFCKLLPASEISAELNRRIANINVGNGFGATVRCVSDEMPDYGSGVGTEGRGSLVHHGMQLLCPSENYLRDAYADFFSGNPSKEPPVLAMTFSPIDDMLAPPGKHVLSLWSQYFPYRRRDGRHWDDCADEMADSILDTLYGYAPNLRGKIGERYIQTPLELERRIGLLHGNVMHVEMSLDQMFCFRPLPELSQYTTPLPGLFMTGASTHPGGGVFGASGLNAAAVVARSFKSGIRRFLSL